MSAFPALVSLVLCASATALGGCAATTSEHATVQTDPALDASADETPDLMSVGCKDLAKRSAKISQDQANGITLLKVRGLKVVKDHRESYRLPKGDGEALLLSCTGTGVWSDITKSPVRLKWTVDADGDDFIEYQPIG
jgi:hypothetical protein